MYYLNQAIHQIATTLLEGLCVKNPTPEQYQAAESFVVMVILSPEEKKIGLEGLTAKEWLCLNLAAGGFSTDETAEMLTLSKGTIKNYRERVRQKLRCKNITHAVYKAFLQAEDSIV